MAATPQATIQNAIDQYLEGRADQVLKEFHTRAEIVGTKKGEHWDRKANARVQLDKDIEAFDVRGAFVTKKVTQSELKNLGEDLRLFHRRERLIFKPTRGKDKRVQGRWTAIIRRYTEGDSHNWRIIHSHFSVEEGDRI